jgi:hypothetical protein
MSEEVATVGAEAQRVAVAEVGRAAKGVREAARTLFEKSLASEQLALFGEPEFEEALLWPADKISKQYTGEHARQIEWRRNTAAYMLQIGCPAEHIAVLLHMNKRLVEALAGQLGAGMAQFTDGYADELLKMAGEMFAVARLKKGEANTLQAATAGGILVDKAMSVKLVSAAGEKPAIEVEAADNKCANLERLILEKKKKANDDKRDDN